MEMPFLQFLGLDFLGAGAYAFVYGAVGFIFRDFVAKIVSGFRAAGHAVEIVIIIAVIAFIGYRVSLYWENRADRVVPRIQVQALAAKLQAEGPEKILLADVRSYGYYSADAEIKHFPRDKDIYLYCTCRNEMTSASVAHLLRQDGFSAFVIVGGLAAWRRAGNPTEVVPKTDVVHLPTFSR
jgi:rhodanese-related sulfurtransferase